MKFKWFTHFYVWGSAEAERNLKFNKGAVLGCKWSVKNIGGHLRLFGPGQGQQSPDLFNSKTKSALNTPDILWLFVIS